MSDAGADDAIVRSADGVTVRKTLEPDEFSTPAIAFEVTSDRAEAVLLRLVDPLPDGASLEEVGFHPDYGSQYWTADEERLTFEYRLDPGEEYTTVYGLRADDVAPYLSDFQIDATAVSDDESPISDVSDVVSPANSEAVRNLIADAETGTVDAEAVVDGAEAADAGETAGAAVADAGDGIVEPDESIADAVGGPGDTGDEIDVEAMDGPTDEPGGIALDDEPEPVEADIGVGESADDDSAGGESAAGSPNTGEQAETIAGDEPNDRGEDETAPEPIGGDLDGDLDDDGEAGEAGETERVIDAGEEADAATGDVAGMTGDSSIVAAIAEEVRQGTATQEDLETVTEALNRTRPSVESRIRYLQNEVTDLASYVDALEAFIDEHGTARDLLGELRAGIESLEADIETIEERTAANDEAIADLDDTVAGIQRDVSDLSTDVDGVEDEVDLVRNDIEELRDDLSDVDEDVSDLDEDVTALDDGLADLDDEIAELDDVISEIDAWRDRFRTVFAPDDPENE